MGDVSRGFFITGTDTGVGKTVVTSACVRALRDEGLMVAAYKPVCSGAEYREGEAGAELRATDDANAGNRLGGSLDSGSLSPASDIAVPCDLTAGERARVRGLPLGVRPPHPDPLPHEGEGVWIVV